MRRFAGVAEFTGSPWLRVGISFLSACPAASWGTVLLGEARPAASWGMGVAGRLAVVGRATSLQVCDQDAHNDVRRDVKTSPNFSRSVHRIQNVLECSSVLESRGIAHPSKCDKETFLARYNDASPQNKRAYTSTQHKLPAVFAEASGHRVQGNA